MEEEVRTLLRAALQTDEPAAGDLAASIRTRFRKAGGVDMRPPPREPIREPPRPRR